MEQFNQYYLDTLKSRYAQFSGRASRSEFWYFILFYFIISILFSVLDTVLGTNYTYEVAANTLVTAGGEMASATVTQTIGYLSSLFGLLMFIPSIAISIRRLHDIGKSGWWLLISLIPIIGFFVLIYFYVQDSQPGENEYGPNPKGFSQRTA
ncbi:MAG: DUF805 domain-containing protein [Campylobacterota bacterium]|nr:DUF805 domain-containing protein [Campylobacterota bacterium]